MFITITGREIVDADTAFVTWLLDTREYSLKRESETRAEWRHRTIAETLEIFRLAYPDYKPPAS